jgi:hypothetical protein
MVLKCKLYGDPKYLRFGRRVVADDTMAVRCNNNNIKRQRDTHDRFQKLPDKIYSPNIELIS